MAVTMVILEMGARALVRFVSLRSSDMPRISVRFEYIKNSFTPEKLKLKLAEMHVVTERWLEQQREIQTLSARRATGERYT